MEDARHLTYRYDKLRQEVEIQVILYLKYKFKCMVAKDLVVNRIHSFQAAEVMRRRAKSRDSSISAESATRLENAEARLSELKSTMMALGREATTAMQSVEAQQQQVTYERLRTMVLLYLVLFDQLSCYFIIWIIYLYKISLRNVLRSILWVNSFCRWTLRDLTTNMPLLI